MTKLRKTLVAAAIAATVTIPVGVAYAADGPATGTTTHPSGMTPGQPMDHADCQKDHAAHQAQMGHNQGDMTGMQNHAGMNHDAMHNGTGTTPGT